jgi:ATP-dependent Lhr-like helicase
LWWTFAGGQINNTLRYALRACHPDWTIVPSNANLRIKGESISYGAVLEAIERIRDVEFWEDPKLWQEVAEDLPNYRLSKFQQFMPPWLVREMVASFLLDIKGAALWLMGRSVTEPEWVGDEVQTPEAPKQVGSPARRTAPVPNAARPQNPVTWVATQDELEAACATLGKARRIGLDVETTMYDQALCLVQMASEAHTWLVDPLAIDDLSPLAELMANAAVAKVIHNATFEKRVLGRHDMQIVNIIDTLKLSRQVRSIRGKGTHTLAAVCQRELGMEIDKECQTSDWRRRPLSEDQLRYAALDAEILLRVLDALPESRQTRLFG